MASTSTQRMAVRRGATDALALPRFPESIAKRDPKLAAELETWRQQAQQNLDHTISALKLDQVSVTAGLVTATQLAAAVAALETALALKVNRAGDTMEGQLYVPQVPDSDASAASKFYADNA